MEVTGDQRQEPAVLTSVAAVVASLPEELRAQVVRVDIPSAYDITLPPPRRPDGLLGSEREQPRQGARDAGRAHPRGAALEHRQPGDGHRPLSLGCGDKTPVQQP
ncbi:hypothetical protein QP028_13305 [Corynebacterium suedekumii]|nr:hypothetical protein QP028_13305 [Corynebacterium suedekumii]